MSVTLHLLTQRAIIFLICFITHMNIPNNAIYNYNTPSYNQKPAFKGRSREVEKILDMVAANPELKAVESEVLIEKIKNALQDILRPSRFIGEGTHNAVFKITQKYAARVPLDANINKNNIGNNLVWGQDVFKNLRNYFGEAIVQLGKLQILKNVGPQIPAGVPEHMTKTLGSGRVKKYYLEKYLPRFARIPQHNYNELACDLARLNEMKFGPRSYGIFDSINPNNIVTSQGKLKLVDEINTLYDKPYGNTTAKLLEVFINRASANSEAPDAGEKIKYVRKIFKKTVLSGLYAGLIHADDKIDYKNWEIALKKCNINDEPYKVIQTLESIEAMPITKEEKMNKAGKYLQSLFGINHMNK